MRPPAAYTGEGVSRLAPSIRDARCKAPPLLLATGWDSWQENLLVDWPSALNEFLDEARAKAAEAGEPIACDFGGETFLIRGHGGRDGGTRWILDNDDIHLRFRCPAKGASTIGVRYLAAGLWEHGISELRRRVLKFSEAIEARPRGPDFITVSFAHFALDYHSPEFTREMVPGIQSRAVLPSGVKCDAPVEELSAEKTREIGSALAVQTLYLGLSPAGLQVVVYDKGREIDEKSGKWWMLELWQRNAPSYMPPEHGRPTDCWRVEIRMPKEWLRDRGIRTPQELDAAAAALIGEALYQRRLTMKTKDSNRRRWPLHWLWAAARDDATARRTYRPLGRQFSLGDSEAIDQGLNSIAGYLIALCVRKVGDYDPLDAQKLALEALRRATNHPELDQRVAIIKDRYRYSKEAQS